VLSHARGRRGAACLLWPRRQRPRLCPKKNSLSYISPQIMKTSDHLSPACCPTSPPRCLDCSPKRSGTSFTAGAPRSVPRLSRVTCRIARAHPRLGSNEQADFSFAEWWVLAQADWLVMLYPSSYSTTAAEVGFGTSGTPWAPAQVPSSLPSACASSCSRSSVHM
jgi:hypothetical protein